MIVDGVAQCDYVRYNTSTDGIRVVRLHLVVVEK
jgi:hypothetical protein